MQIKVFVDGAFCKLSSNISKELYDSLSHTLSYLPDDYQWRDSYTMYGGNGRVKFLRRGKFPTGLLPYVEEFCVKHDIELITSYRENTNTSNLLTFEPPAYSLSPKYTLRDYQSEAIDTIIQKKRCLIQCPTGSGKSLIAARLIEHVDQYPALVCLMSKDLLEQTVKNYEEYLGIKVGKITGGKFDIQPVTIAMVQTLVSALKRGDANVKQYLNSIKCLVVDECHHQVANTVQQVSYNCSAADIRVGMSGTTTRDLADDMEIEAALGPISYKLTVSDLIRKGMLVKPKIYMFTMPTAYRTSKPYPQYTDIIADYIENNMERNKIIANLVRYLLDDTDRNCLILCNRINHGNTLESLIPGSVFVHGSTPLEERTKVFEDFKERRLKTLIATSIIDEGWDCPNLDSLVLAHPYKSVVKCFQRIGRALRKYPGKEEAIIVDFYDNVKYLDRHAGRRLSLYANESEFEVIHKEIV